MFGLGFLGIDLSPSAAHFRKQKAEAIERLLETPVPWDPDAKFVRGVTAYRADTYKPLKLFDVAPAPSTNPEHVPEKCKVYSGDRKWVYMETTLKRGMPLKTFCGNRFGQAVFDGEITIPTLWEVSRIQWSQGPWMSLTPSEVHSLRPGTKKAKGRTIVAGLGLGYQLIEVSRRKAVKELVLIEQDQSLIDWLLPVIGPHLGRPINETVVGNVYEVMQNMTADVALVDVFPAYGNNDYEQGKLRSQCKLVDHIWCWGAAKIGDWR